MRHRCIQRVLSTTPARSLPACVNLQSGNTVGQSHARSYANPARFNLPTKIAYKPPPAPVQPTPTVEDGHQPGEVKKAAGPFDRYLETTFEQLSFDSVTDVPTLYRQYRDRAGLVLDLVVPYEERPAEGRKAHAALPLDHAGTNSSEQEGDGLVMVVHALRKPDGRLGTICACSGFVVNAQPVGENKSPAEVVITCAHTLEEMHRKLPRTADANGQQQQQQQQPPSSISFVISSTGRLYTVDQVLSSVPKSDLLALQLKPVNPDDQSRLRTLPLSPFPVYTGGPLLTHLFEAAEPPKVNISVSRLPPATRSAEEINREHVEKPTPWLADRAWRRWGLGTMLGYRSYTGIEVEAGIHSSLPHIMTSVLPTAGSSGGPLVCAETGAVVGMISGRRMDNRVEGERGWGASAEGIFEMFSLPGFKPSSQK